MKMEESEESKFYNLDQHVFYTFEDMEDYLEDRGYSIIKNSELATLENIAMNHPG